MKNNKYKEIFAIFIIVLVTLLFRKYDTFVRPQLWAEAFPIIFKQNGDLGIKALITPYAGYLMTLPRIIAYFISLFSVNYLYIPLTYNYIAFFITFFICVGLWDFARKLNIKNRVLYATVFLLLPISSELFMDLASTQWLAGLYLINYIFTWDKEKNEKYYYLNLLMLFVFSVSGPFSTLLCPIIVIMMIPIHQQTPMRRIFPLLMILLGGAIQVICMKFIDPNFYRGVLGEPEHFHLMKLFTKNVSQIFFMNSGLLPEMSDRFKTVSSLLILGLLTYLFIKNYLKIEHKRKYIMVLAAFICFVSFIKAYWPNESKILSLENVRYYFIPYSCVCWLMIIAMDDKIKIRHVMIYIFFMLLHSHFLQMKLIDKHWKEEINEYYQGKREIIDINPEGWAFPMPKKK